ncbi:MAG: hypothetical protein IKO91_05805 [Oscillospiraceae bacterium]|nr:hypothetical protein [Oscillospiraceae bacterium]
MLKAYRRRFVLYNLLLVGVVLLAALTVQGIRYGRESRRELQNTLRLVLEPWDTPGERFRPLGEGMPEKPGDAPALPPEGAPEPPPFPDGDGSALRPDGRGWEADVVTLYYSAETGEISVLSGDSLPEAALLASAAPEIAGRAEDSGYLSEYSLYYCRAGDPSGCRIALAGTGYLRGRILRNILFLLLAFLGGMGLIFLISLRLAKLAAKPMEDAVQMERQFVTNLSHDLKTPITVILANNSILRSSPAASDGEVSAWVESTDAAAHGMLDLVNEMLTLSSLEEAGKKMELSPQDLSEAAERAALQLEPLAWEKGAALETEPGEGIRVQASAEGLQRICSGLIENAVKYEPKGGKVTVRAERGRKTAVLTVHNQGSFIPPEDLGHIFERFYRGDKSRSGGGGFGLGLPILRQLAQLQGAEIDVKSEPGSGTVFTVTFPLAE